MSMQTFPYQAPEGAKKTGKARVPATVLGAMAAVGLLLWLPGQARADRVNTEITLGFPHGQVTVGKTWGDDPRRVVVDEPAPRYPADADIYDQDEPVTVVAQEPEPAQCEPPVRVIRKVYAEPRYERPEIVVYRRSPERVIYAPERTVIVAPRREIRYYEGDRRFHGEHHAYAEHGYREYQGDHGDHRDGGGYGGNSRGNQGGYQSGDQGGSHGPRNLFPEDQGRPMRSRGVQQHLAQH